jgi:hypothetical protein
LFNNDTCPRPTTQECKLTCEEGFAASSGAVITLMCGVDPVHGGPATPDGSCEENKCAHYVIGDGEMPGDADGCSADASFRLLPTSDTECTLKCKPGYTAMEDPFKVECPAGSVEGADTTKCVPVHFSPPPGCACNESLESRPPWNARLRELFGLGPVLARRARSGPTRWEVGFLTA